MKSSKSQRASKLSWLTVTERWAVSGCRGGCIGDGRWRRRRFRPLHLILCYQSQRKG